MCLDKLILQINGCIFSKPTCVQTGVSQFVSMSRPSKLKAYTQDCNHNIKEYVFSMDINAELQIFLIIFIFIQCAINLSQPSSYNRLYFDRLLCYVNILTFTGHLYILHESE